MANSREKTGPTEPKMEVGGGGEVHFVAESGSNSLTTNQGTAISDNQNSLLAASRGPVLLEDFILREKITHFDHERIPERVVHARGYGAHGYFQCYKSFSDLTAAQFLGAPDLRTPVFVRFSTVAGSAGSADTARDIRGFAVKFYTQEGNFDLVGNNIPVFFIQDAMKFPDLVHSLKPEPDRGFPQAQSAHDTFWDFVSYMPESAHTLLWVMSDRAIPRSYRMMPGFGVHTFQFVSEDGAVRLVKFHWRPRLGTISLVWDEAVRIAGADPDYHRRDLWNAIESGRFPEWELSVQQFTQEEAEGLGIDPLDATKLIPEELVPLTPLGKMVLDRNVDNFFAETEQVAFCPANLVRGIGFSNDPLLQGRLFSYLDTQLSRLGGTNFHQIPINAPKCPIQNFMRDGHFQMQTPRGRVSYEPSGFEPNGPHESRHGYQAAQTSILGHKDRVRPSAFSDHFSQATLFFESQSDIERKHIVDAFTFELGKCRDVNVRQRVVGLLSQINSDLADEVGENLGIARGKRRRAKDGPAAKASGNRYDSLSQLKNLPKSVSGKNIGVLLSNGFDAKWLNQMLSEITSEQASATIITPTPNVVVAKDDVLVAAVDFLDGAPSCLFDAVIVAADPQDLMQLEKVASAIDWIRSAFMHLKVIGFVDRSEPLIVQADIGEDEGVIKIEGRKFGAFLSQLKVHRVWTRSVP